MYVYVCTYQITLFFFFPPNFPTILGMHVQSHLLVFVLFTISLILEEEVDPDP